MSVKNNIDSSLQKKLGVEINDDKPENTYRLNNSEHYFEPNNTSFKKINMFYELTKDIRNLKPLSKIQLEYVKTLPKEKIIELLEIYNICLKTMNMLLEKI